MTCLKCRRSFDGEEPRCPHCGEPNPEVSGLFQTSTVLISTGSAPRIYRSVDEVPVKLRGILLKSTNGANSATILIADRRGRSQIAKAMRSLPSHAQRRLMSSVLGVETASSLLQWMTPARKRAILTVLAFRAPLAVGSPRKRCYPVVFL
jgi:hypothetical protein